MNESTIEERLTGASARLVALLDPPAPPDERFSPVDAEERSTPDQVGDLDASSPAARSATQSAAAQLRAVSAPNVVQIPTPKYRSNRRIWLTLGAAAAAVLVIGTTLKLSGNTSTDIAKSDTSVAGDTVPGLGLPRTQQVPETSAAAASEEVPSETVAAAAPSETVPAVDLTPPVDQSSGAVAEAPAAEASKSSDSDRAYSEPVPAATVPVVRDERKRAPSRRPGALDDRVVAPVPPPDRYYVPTTTIVLGSPPFAGLPGGTETAYDPQSTFALDVDTGSWSRVRDRLRTTGSYDPNEVRTEEILNAFRQDYPAPSGSDTFAIHLDGSPTPFLPDDVRVLRVGIQAKRVAEVERKQASLTFVVDVSGSMEEGGKLELVKGAIATLVQRLDRNDRVAIVAFSDEAWIALPTTPGSERDRIMAALSSLQPTNSTNAEAGLSLGYDLARGSFIAGGTNRVVLASDGVANVGPTGPEAISARIKEQAGRGIDLVTVGVGNGAFNDQMMEQLADKGNGFYTYIDSPEQASKVFSQQLIGTLETVARDAKAQVTFDPGKVRAYRLLGYENRAVADSQFRNDHIDAGEIGAGHSVTALYEVQIIPGARGTLGRVDLRWKSPTGKVEQTDASIEPGTFTDDILRASPRFQQDVYIGAWAEILRGGPWAARVTIDDLASRVQRLPQLLPEDSDVRDLAELVQRTTGAGFPAAVSPPFTTTPW